MDFSVQNPKNGEISSKFSRRPQYLVCSILCLGGFLAGTVQGWSSPALFSIKKSEHFKDFNTSHLSWIASLSMLGAFVGSPPGGYLIRKLGRKYTLLITAIPYFIGWVLLTIPTHIWMFYAGRVFIGIGLGLMVLANSVYMSEISEPELRGRMSVIWFVALRLGIIFEYGVGAILPYNHLSLISAVISVAYGISIFFIPESPRWLMTKWKRQQAIDSLCWLRGCDKESPWPKILSEIEEIHQAVLRSDKDNKESLAIFSSYFTSWIVIKSILIGFILMIFKEGSGGNIFSFYNLQILEKTGSALDPNLSSVLIGVAQLVGILVTTYYVDKVGRRILLIITFIVMSLSLILVGVYCQFRSEIQEITSYSGWIPLVIWAIFHAVYSGGPFVLTYTVMSEVIPTNVIGSISGLVTSISWISGFVWLRYYEDMNDALGIANTFWFFALVSAAGAVCISLFVPETVGKSLENIHRDTTKNSCSENKNENTNGA